MTTDHIEPERVDPLAVDDTTPADRITVPDDATLRNMIYDLGRADLNAAEELAATLDREAKVEIVREHRAMLLG